MGMLPYGHRLLAGPPASAGAESLADHVGRLGPLVMPADRRWVLDRLDRSGLLGRGGAGFPVGRKWRSVAERSTGRSVVVANGAEGEPRSSKDRVLMRFRPQLVLDGALLAADVVGASEIMVYVGEEHGPARAAMARAVDERVQGTGRPTPRITLVAAPIGYIAGEASAAVHFINAGDARPTISPPRPSEAGVHGRPTLVQNVESLAYAALIARFGDDWYREVGRGQTRGTALITVSGAVPAAGVHEVELGTSIGELAAEVGGRRDDVAAVLVGGYFGTWIAADAAWDLPLDPVVMRDRGLTFGCGMVSFLERDACGLAETTEIIEFLAGGSARQCGPCLHGLRAIADACGNLTVGRAGPRSLADIDRWIGMVAGRGACRHPDGAAGFMASARDVFADDFRRHAAGAPCTSPRVRIDAA